MTLLVALPVLLLAPGLVGHPVVSYVASASMVPALHVGDGVLVQPWPGELQVGDVVVYASELQAGGLAVHRIVAGDASGWITQGDANPTTDQAVGESPVTPERVRGRVVEAGGAPLVIPGLGLPWMEAGVQVRALSMATGGTTGLLAAGLGALAVVLLLLPEARPGDRGPRGKLAARTRRVVTRAAPRGAVGRHGAAAAFAGFAVLSLFLASAAHEVIPMSLVVVDGPPPDQARSAAPGQMVPRQLHVNALPLASTAVFLEGGPHVRATEGVALDAGASIELVVHEVAGAEPGLQQDTVEAWRYPAYLPLPAMAALHHALPGSPAVLPALLMLVVLLFAYRSLGVGDVPLRLLVPARPGGAR